MSGSDDDIPTEHTMRFAIRDPGMPAERVIELLGLAPHPEGGHYRETCRDVPAQGGRGAVTAILYLLRAGERSHWHRVDAAELWFYHEGDPLELRIATDERSAPDPVVLGADFGAGQRLQGCVPRDAWQAARPLGRWTLVSCVVAPAFEFAGFTLAPPGWEPGPR